MAFCIYHHLKTQRKPEILDCFFEVWKSKENSIGYYLDKVHFPYTNVGCGKHKSMDFKQCEEIYFIIAQVDRV